MSDTSAGTMTGMRSLGTRLPDDLYAWLADLAAREHRSLNAQLIVLLERHRELMEYERGNLPSRETPPPPSR